jgi:hypothetical protein
MANFILFTGKYWNVDKITRFWSDDNGFNIEVGGVGGISKITIRSQTLSNQELETGFINLIVASNNILSEDS